MIATFDCVAVGVCPTCQRVIALTRSLGWPLVECECGWKGGVPMLAGVHYFGSGAGDDSRLHYGSPILDAVQQILTAIPSEARDADGYYLHQKAWNIAHVAAHPFLNGPCRAWICPVKRAESSAVQEGK